MIDLIGVQRDIYAQIAVYIRQFAGGGIGWVGLLAMLPLGVVFGAAHALTPGHSKAVLATYVAGSPIGAVRALLTSITLSFTHVTMAVIIALLALPLVSIALGSVGRAPALEGVSRGLLGIFGLCMLWRAWRHPQLASHEGSAVGFLAGLIPCPLTLFVMSLSMARGVPGAGLMFAAAMMIGVALTLSAVALAAVAFRHQLLRAAGGMGWSRNMRVMEGACGLLLIAISAYELLR